MEKPMSKACPIPTPTITNVTARSAFFCSTTPGASDQDLEQEVLVSKEGKAGNYTSIFKGTSTECCLTDLTPNTEYHVKVCAVVRSLNLNGASSDIVSFKTDACEPDQPSSPKLINRTKVSIQLRWNVPNDNGAQIEYYILERDEGPNLVGQAGQFVTIYDGRAKSFNVTKLTPATQYKFRVIAVNKIGQSKASEIGSYLTQKSAPIPPDPPSLAMVTESSAHLIWTNRPSDNEFTLQMDSGDQGQGFQTVYNGSMVEHTVTGLRRETRYRFKIRAHNEMGAGQYSQIVDCTTRQANMEKTSV